MGKEGGGESVEKKLRVTTLQSVGNEQPGRNSGKKEKDGNGNICFRRSGKSKQPKMHLDRTTLESL